MERFWDKVDRSGGPDACWPWTAALDSSGYGLFRWRGRLWKTHRLALGLSGQLPLVGEQACHGCDNRPCCNPRHLRWDRQQANVDDRQARGRWARGKGSQRLSQEQGAEIRARFDTGESRVSIARAFGVHVSHVYRIGKGQTVHV